VIIGLLVIGITLTGIALYLIYTQPTTITITYPANTAQVSMWEWVSGTSQNIPNGYELWIVVKVDGLHFLHKVNTINKDGTWQHNVQIGQENENGKNFDLIAVLANSSAQETAQYWLKNNDSANRYDLRELPAGMIPYNAITVERVSEKSSISPSVTVTSPTPSNLGKSSGEPSVVIIYPANNTDVSMWEWVRGTSQNIPSGHELWIVVRWGSLYFPMYDRVQRREDGTWMYRTSIGRENDSGKTFEIIAVLADSSAQTKINAWHQNPYDLYSLPSGMTRCSSVTVERD
jgi:hypothetical protein